ncbi:hypothetical protein XENTR_v10013624 [Xenopus tropicalis]|nr:hypothetical protein XENTR_v10013624 [Xenopus tropicalis]
MANVTTGYIMALSLYLGFALSFALLAVVTVEMMVGAPQASDPNTEGVNNATNFALEQYNLMSNDARSYKLIDLIAVKTQVVAGVNYYLTMKIGATNCRKNSENLEACELAQNDEAQTRICTFQVYSIPWKNTMSLEDSNCEAV